MVIMEAHRGKERRLQQFRPSGECLVEDVDEIQKQVEHGLARDSQLVGYSSAPPESIL